MRYSVYNSHLTNIQCPLEFWSDVLHSYPALLPVLVLLSVSPPGTVYIHPRPSTPYPPSPPPPPPAPRPVVYQQTPFPVPVASVFPAAAPVAPVLPDPEPWWYGLL